MVQLEFRKVGFWGEGRIGVPREKHLGPNEGTNNKLNQIWRLCRDLSSSHISERRAPSLLRNSLLSITNEGQYFRIREVIIWRSPYRVQNFKWMLFTGWCLGGFLVGGFLVGLGFLFLHLFLFLFFPLHFFLFLFLSGFLFFFFFGLLSASSPSSAACSSTGPNGFPGFFSLISLISGFVISNLQTSPLAEGRL